MRAQAGSHRGPLTGATISAVAGAAWALWAASGSSGGAAVTIQAVGVVIGLVLVVAAVRQRRRTSPDQGGSMFATRSYRVVVLIEVVAIVAGSAVLGRTGQGAYVIAWVALVVGAHFLAFGRLYHPRFSALGVAMIAAAVAGTVVGLSGATVAAVDLVTGLISALGLFAAAAVTVGAVRRECPRPESGG